MNIWIFVRMIQSGMVKGERHVIGVGKKRKFDTEFW
jgi:hypothetical protein